MAGAFAVLGALLLGLTMNWEAPFASRIQAAPFAKQGEASFRRQANSEEIARIGVEVADTPARRARGLMHRGGLPVWSGMLFIFDSPRELTFWMKDTLIPLDIIFVSAQGRIVSIARGATPLSEELIHSGDKAMYAIEVNAGFCDRHGIGEGDLVSLYVSRGVSGERADISAAGRSEDARSR